MQSSFLNAILAAPEDLELRLVYADWLEQQGDPRAEFIRVQIELEEATESFRASPAFEALRVRERVLFEKHHRYWNGELHRLLAGTPLRGQVGRGRAIRRWRYRRGFVEDIVADVRVLFDHPDVLFQLGPLRRLSLRGAMLDEARIRLSPAFERLNRVTLLARPFNARSADQQVVHLLKPGPAQVVQVLRPAPENLPPADPPAEKSGWLGWIQRRLGRSGGR